ncbi:MAG TPA: cadmium-translocating P-type ATPase [Eubacteriaceae bacterium]|nr:cadmium-translocating P-type ATPase [Eubacteriaceae bacterium]
MSETTRKKTIPLKNLSCANCALKMEDRIRRMDEIKEVQVDFTSQKMVVESEYFGDQLLEKMESTMQKIEPDVAIVRESDQKGEEESVFKKHIIKLIVGSVVFAYALLSDHTAQIELILYITAYLIVGENVLKNAIKGIFRGEVFSEFFLMSVATIGAFFVGEYPEGVGVMLFFLIGEIFQDKAVDRSRKSISDLMDIKTDYVNVYEEGVYQRKDPKEVKIDEIFIVKPGEKIPLDGVVVKGESMVDTSALTGESLPREIGVGEEALGGFINTNGILEIKTTKIFEDSTVSKILELVENASSKKAPTERFISKFARYYTPVVVFSALAVALVPPLVLPQATFEEWIYRALIFLVISCPCALVVSIPLGFFGGIGGASKKGILIKGANYLEGLNQVTSVVFDKTGTLTKGVFEVTDIQPQGDISKDQLLEYAAYGESFSNHPIAKSLVRAYARSIDANRIENYEERSGKGVRSILDGQTILCGNKEWMKANDIEIPLVDVEGSIVYVALKGRYLGHIVIADTIKEDSIQTIRQLKELGIQKTVMLTGDRERTARRIAEELGIDEVYFELLPDEKVKMMEQLQNQQNRKEKIIYVGDGINDAPVLARSDIGVAMGGLGSDAAIEAADVVFMEDEPSKLPTALKIARRTRKIVYQNIVFALGIKGIFLIFGAFGMATMWEAVFADVGVALLAVLNASRVLKIENLK